MDLNLEKEKLEYSHKLETRRLLIEKALFGIIVVAVGLFVNIFFEQYRSNLERDRSLFFEEYKSKLGQERFLLEKRLEAVSAIQEAFSQMQEEFLNYTSNDKRPKDYRERYKKAIENYIHISNKWEIVVSREFTHKVENVLWVYQGFDYSDVAQCAEYRDFATDLSESFNSACRTELGLPQEANKSVFTLTELDWHQADSLGGEDVLDYQYKAWEEWSKSKTR